MGWLKSQDLRSDSSNQVQDLAASYCQMEEDHLNIEIVAALLFIYLELQPLFINTHSCRPSFGDKSPVIGLLAALLSM